MGRYVPVWSPRKRRWKPYGFCYRVEITVDVIMNMSHWRRIAILRLHGAGKKKLTERETWSGLKGTVGTMRTVIVFLSHCLQIRGGFPWCPWNGTGSAQTTEAVWRLSKRTRGWLWSMNCCWKSICMVWYPARCRPPIRRKVWKHRLSVPELMRTGIWNTPDFLSWAPMWMTARLFRYMEIQRKKRKPQPQSRRPKDSCCYMGRSL